VLKHQFIWQVTALKHDRTDQDRYLLRLSGYALIEALLPARALLTILRIEYVRLRVFPKEWLYFAQNSFDVVEGMYIINKMTLMLIVT